MAETSGCPRRQSWRCPADVGSLRSNKSVQLSVVADGAAAMAYLRREGKYVEATRPDLILLDLNLPKMGGWEVLAQIKADDDLQSIPIVILTTSSAEEDVNECYKLNANSPHTEHQQFLADKRLVATAQGGRSHCQHKITGRFQLATSSYHPNKSPVICFADSGTNGRRSGMGQRCRLLAHEYRYCAATECPLL
jgi:CheY-like chemotaxis protein